MIVCYDMEYYLQNNRAIRVCLIGYWDFNRINVVNVLLKIMLFYKTTLILFTTRIKILVITNIP